MSYVPNNWNFFKLKRQLKRSLWYNHVCMRRIIVDKKLLKFISDLNIEIDYLYQNSEFLHHLNLLFSTRVFHLKERKLDDQNHFL